MKRILFILSILLSVSLHAESISVFGATATKPTMEELKNEFLKNRSGDEIVLHSGSSGKAYTQFTNGFKYDLFFSADSKYPQEIVDSGYAKGEAKPYAYGKVALYSLDEALLASGVAGLKEPKVKKVSIANPKVAPYGIAAIEILKNSGVYEEVESKIVMGENLSQAIHFVDSGAADVGLVAYSLLKEGGAPKGKHILIDDSLYQSLKQSFVITKYGADKKLATEFAEFVTSPKGKEIIEKYGFGAPK